MRTALAMVLMASFAVATEVGAQTPVGPSPRQPAPPDDRVHTGTGVVNGVDVQRGRVRLRHEPIPGVGLGATTSDFVVADRAELAELKPGQSVRFELKPLGNQYVLSAIRRERAQ